MFQHPRFFKSEIYLNCNSINNNFKRPIDKIYKCIIAPRGPGFTRTVFPILSVALNVS